MYLKTLTDIQPEIRNITNENIVIQMDNTWVHWSINSLKFYRENKINVIDWPLNISDLNPIEILWFILIKQIGDQKYQKNQLILKIHSIQEKIDEV